MSKIFWHILIAVFLLWGSMAMARAATTVALLAPPNDKPANNMIALLNSTWSAKANISLVERQQVEQVLHEQVLAQCMAAEGVAQRVELGRLLRADVLVFINSFDKPVPHIQVVVCETHQGLRLLVEPAALTANPETDAKNVAQQLDVALARSKQPIHLIVAVPPLACNDLFHSDFETLGPAYALLIEQALLKREGVLVVQLAEAQALGREMAIAGQANIDRPLPLIVLGEYRNDGTGDQRRISFQLTFKRGDNELKKSSQEKIAPQDTASALVELSSKLLETNLAGIHAKPDADADAAQLVSRGSALAFYGQFQDALQLYEASLLLRPKPEIHEKAAHVIMMKLVEEEYKAGHRTGNAGLDELNKARAMLLVPGMWHCEEYMKNTKLDQLHDFTARAFVVNLPVDIVRPMLLRIMKAKYEAKIQDDILWYVDFFLGGWHSTPKAKYQYLNEVAAYLGPGTNPYLMPGMTWSVEYGTAASADLRAALEQMSTLDNPFARNTAALMTRRLKAGLPVVTDQPFSSQKGVPIVPDMNPEIRIVRFAHNFKGIMPVGKDIDLLWSYPLNIGESSEMSLMTKRGELRKIGTLLYNVRPCFDGRYVWTLGNSPQGMQITVTEPETQRQWTFGRAEGLPPNTINNFAAAPWEPGRICAAASFGEVQDVRSWIATIGFSPNKGFAFHIVQEGRLRHEYRVNDQDPNAAIEPSDAFTLVHAGAHGVPPITMVVIGESNRWLDVQEKSTGTSVTYNTGFFSLNGVGSALAIRDGMRYWITGSELRRAGAGAPECNVINNSVPPYTPLCLAENRAYVFSCDNNLALWMTEDIAKPFHRLRTGWSKESIPDVSLANHANYHFYQSNYYGLILANDVGDLYQLLDKEGHPLPWK